MSNSNSTADLDQRRIKKQIHECIKTKGKINNLVYAANAMQALGIEIKRNLLTTKIEAHYRDTVIQINLEGGVEKLSYLLGKSFGGDAPCQTHIETTCKAIAKDYDTCREFYEDLPTVDHENKSAIEALFVCGEADLAMYDATCEQIVMRLAQAGWEAPHMLTLKGREGIGKSMLVRKLACGWLVKDNLLRDTNIVLRKITGSLVCEVEELNWRRENKDKIKAIISSTEDTFDDKYEKNKKVKRRCLFIGTTNNDNPYPHDTDGRRFWTIDCKPTPEVVAIMQTDDKDERAKAWGIIDKAIGELVLNDLAKAKERVKAGARGLLSKKHTDLARERYRANTFSNESVTNLLEEIGEEAIKDTKRARTSKGVEFWKMDDILRTLLHKWMGIENEAYPHRGGNAEDRARDRREVTMIKELQTAKTNEVSSWLKRKGYEYKPYRAKGSKVLVKAWGKVTK